jgi:glycosyltransferase involved in cell wall biosynthesis
VQFGPYGRIYGGFYGEPMLFLMILLRLAGLKRTMTLHSTWMTSQVKEKVRSYRFTGRFAILAPAVFRIFMRIVNWATDTLQLSTVKKNSMLRKRFLKEYSYFEGKLLEIPFPCCTWPHMEEKKTAARWLGIPNRKIILLFGFIRRNKGIEIALEAMSILKELLPDTILLVAGRTLEKADRYYLDEVIKLVHRRGLDGFVRFDTKYIPDDTMVKYFSAASVLIVPYTESVGVSSPIHECAGYGVPVVASDAGYHLKETLGGNIVLFRRGDSVDLARKISELLTNPDLAHRIREAQVEYAEAENWEVAAKRTVRNYLATVKILELNTRRSS